MSLTEKGLSLKSPSLFLHNERLITFERMLKKMIIIETIEIEITNGNIKYYETLNYNIPKLPSKGNKMKLIAPQGTKILVKIEDLSKSSRIEIPYECDYCGKSGLKTFQSLMRSRKIIEKDCCKSCHSLKTKETNLIKYGVTNVALVENVKNKMKETNLNKYGAEYAVGAKEVRDKITKTNIEKFGGESPFSNELVQNKAKETIKVRYGVENVNQNSDIRQKTIETNIKRYGAENPIQNKDVIKKRNATMIEKYGVMNPMQNEEIKRKQRITYNKVMYSNGKMPCSSQQKYLHEILGGELNYPVDEIVVDIAFPREKIYLEYDGGGHDYSVKIGDITEEQFKTKEIKRYYFMRNKGWKFIKIKSVNDNLPSDIEIIKFIEFAKEYLKKHSWISLDVKSQKIEGNDINEFVIFEKMLAKKEIHDKFISLINYRF